MAGSMMGSTLEETKDDRGSFQMMNGGDLLKQQDNYFYKIS